MTTDAPVTTARELAEAWQAVLGRLQVELPAHNFNTWLRGTRALSFDGARLLVEARTALSCEWLNIKLAAAVERAAAAQLGRALRVEFVPQGSAAVAASDVQPASPVVSAARNVIGTVNCNYTFERFLQADGNAIALESCLAVLDPAALPVSPVVLYGAPGMGKTHLLHALACEAGARGRRLACLSGEEFTNRIQAAIREHTLDAFKAEVRSVDLLVVDDLQYLAGKKFTLDELVHTMEAVKHAGGHVIIASERHPRELELPARVTERLVAGLVIRLEPLRLEERKRFIEQTARDFRVSLPAWAIERIAGCDVPSTRVLQGAVHAALLLARGNRLDHARLDAELTAVAIAELAPASLGDRELVEAIASHFHATFEALAGRSRVAAISRGRAIAIFALHQRGRSLSQIAALFDARDRSTISELQARGRELLAREPALRERLAV